MPPFKITSGEASIEPNSRTETLVAALSMSTIAESEHAHSEAFDSPESCLSSMRRSEAFQSGGFTVILLEETGIEVEERHLVVAVDNPLRSQTRQSQQWVLA